MSLPPPARLLDLTRLVSRLGRGALTGIDRVELAYLRHFVNDEVPMFGLVRTRLGFLLLDREAGRHLLARVAGSVAPGQSDLIGRLTRGSNSDRGRDEADLRSLARARCLRGWLVDMLRRHVPQGTDCYLVGHADLSGSILTALRRGSGGRIAVLLHDTIPLDHPEVTRPGTAGHFGGQVRAIAGCADLVILSSAAAKARAVPHLVRSGRLPPTVIAPLGVELARPAPEAVPADLVGDGRPLFLALGTLEPRKNHALLLDVWKELPATLPEHAVPRLILAGARGWSNDAVFRRLDGAPDVGRTVVECPGLSDGAIASLMDRAEALLFPSLAEGFGLPPAEAAVRGLPVIATPLPALREVLGDYPLYLSADDPQAWRNAVLGMTLAAGKPDRAARRGLVLPGWDAHFNIVLNHR